MRLCWLMMAWFSWIARERRRAEVLSEAWRDLDAPCPYSDFTERRWWREGQQEANEWYDGQ